MSCLSVCECCVFCWLGVCVSVCVWMHVCVCARVSERLSECVCVCVCVCVGVFESEAHLASQALNEIACLAAPAPCLAGQSLSALFSARALCFGFFSFDIATLSSSSPLTSLFSPSLRITSFVFLPPPFYHQSDPRSTINNQLPTSTLTAQLLFSIFPRVLASQSAVQ